MADYKELVFATSNNNKIIEINRLLPKNLLISLKMLHDMGIEEELPETRSTIEGNAIQKAQYIYDNYGYNCFAEDTGLVVKSLNGEPGIYSARYAGEDRDDDKNMNKVLEKLKTKSNRRAHFKTVIALIIDGILHTFEGKIEGEISLSKRGDSGFGYDPIFRPNGYDQTFAEIGINEKNKISHRAKALNKLITFLKNYYI